MSSKVYPGQKQGIVYEGNILLIRNLPFLRIAFKGTVSWDFRPLFLLLKKFFIFLSFFLIKANALAIFTIIRWLVLWIFLSLSMYQWWSALPLVHLDLLPPLARPMFHLLASQPAIPTLTDNLGPLEPKLEVCSSLLLLPAPLSTMQPPLVGFYPEVPDVSIEAEVLDGILHLLKHCQEELTLLGIQGSQLCTSVGNTWNRHNFGAGVPAALRITGSVCKCFWGVHGAGGPASAHSPPSTWYSYLSHLRIVGHS